MESQPSLLFEILKHLGEHIGKHDAGLMFDYVATDPGLEYGARELDDLNEDVRKLVRLMNKKGHISETEIEYTNLIKCLNGAGLKNVANRVQKMIADHKKKQTALQAGCLEKVNLEKSDSEDERRNKPKFKAKKRKKQMVNLETSDSEDEQIEKPKSKTKKRRLEKVNSNNSDGEDEQIENSESKAKKRGATATALVDEADSELSDSLEYLDDIPMYGGQNRLQLNPCRKAKIRNLFTSNTVYRMTGPTRGRCVVINNKEFDVPSSPDQIELSTRDGSEMDVVNVSMVFKALSFKVDTHSNLSSQEMMGIIQEETKNQSMYGMFVLVIMSHGTENKVYGRDGRAVGLSTVYDCLSPYKFTAMAGKPKVVIVQACSGEKIDQKGSNVYDTPLCGNAPNTTARLSSGSDKHVVQKPQPGEYLTTDDLYIMKASFLGYVSSRHIEIGTWFIRSLVEALYKHACHRDLQSLFQQVKRKVRAKSLRTPNVSGQQPTDECTFTDGKKLYLFPEYNPKE